MATGEGAIKAESAGIHRHVRVSRLARCLAVVFCPHL